LKDPKAGSDRSLQISDDQVRETLVPAQLKLQQERGTDVAIFSPGAGKMAHHVGTFETSSEWSRACNDLIAQVCRASVPKASSASASSRNRLVLSRRPASPSLSAA
jgi:hypothetical protein